ncbi:unannotated protein [freshwater metagenome]|uniref:Unannotated protein n=1 Tax=freshwater metagenome TaxID=449393 RepID=A0A6J7LJN3_9ZZZZ
MAMSATLKTGKFGKAMKSTTEPMPGLGGRVIRSMRFPRSPPRSPPKATDQAIDPSCREVRMMTTATTIAMMEKIHV